jgi:hypothetical protein
VIATYLPAFFVAGALCLIAAALVLTINRRRDESSPLLVVPAPAQA